MYRLRQMQTSDLAEVSRLGIRSKATWGYTDEVMEVFREELTHDFGLLTQSIEAIVAEADEKIVGYFTLVRHDDAVVELDFMFVLPEFIGKGVGTLMMQHAIELALSHEAKYLSLIADPNAVGFYERFDAEQIGEHQSSIPGRAIPVMRIRLI